MFLDCFYPCIFTHETYIHIYIYICINLANCHDILDILNDITQPQHHRCMTFIIRFFRFVLPWPPAMLQSTASGAPRDFSRALRSVKPGGSRDMVVSNMGLFHGKTPQKTSLITVLLGTPILENLRINSRALKNAPKPKSNDSQGRWIGEIHAFHPEIGTKMDQILRSSWIGPRRTYPGDMFRLGKAFHVKWGNPATGAVVSLCCWPYGCGQWMSVVYGLFVLQFENEVKWWYHMHSNLFNPWIECSTRWSWLHNKIT